MTAPLLLLVSSVSSAGAVPDPADTKPGWIALFVVLGLAAATVLLWLSMRRHLGRIRFDRDDADDATEQETRPRGPVD